MSAVVINGDTSGSITLQAPAVAGTNTLTLPANTGTVLTSASSASDLPSSIKGPAFSAVQSSATSCANNTTTKILFQTEIFDTNNNYDGSISRFTPTVAGYYQINVNVQWQGGAATSKTFALKLYKNGSQYKEINVIPNMILYTRNIGTSLVYLNGSTDYLEVYAFQDSGATVNIGGDEFSGSMVRSA